MDLEARKLSFIQEFLRLQNEEIVEKLESLLRTQKKEWFEKNLKPMTKAQFLKEIELALQDAEKDNVIEAKSLKEKLATWS